MCVLLTALFCTFNLVSVSYDELQCRMEINDLRILFLNDLFFLINIQSHFESVLSRISRIIITKKYIKQQNVLIPTMYIEVLDYAHEEYQFGSLNDFFCFFLSLH